MNPNSILPPWVRDFRHGLAIMLATFSAVMSLQGAPITLDVAGPATLIRDSSSNVLGDLKLGDILKASFTYDPDDLVLAGYTPETRSYVSNTAQIAVAIGTANYDFTRLEMIVTEGGFYGFYDGTTAIADSMLVRAIYGQGRVAFDALLLYRKGTLSRFDPTAPDADPGLVSITWSPPFSVDPAGAFSLAHLGDLSVPPPPLTPVPEPSTYSAIGSLLLLGLAGWRHRKGKKLVSSSAKISRGR